EERGRLPLGRGEVAVARRQREAVLLAHDGRTDDLDRQIEIAREPLDDEKLLKVLLAEHRRVGRALHEELGHDRGNALEMIRPRRAAQIVGEAPAAPFWGETRRG